MVQLGFRPLNKDPTVPVKFLSAGFAGCIADLITFPLDTAKVRLQIQGEGTTPKGGAGFTAPGTFKYRGILGTLLTITRDEGARGMYGGLPAGLQRQLCFASVRIGLYDVVRGKYQEMLGSPGDKNFGIRVLAGITTGGLAVACAQPTDVVKVRMQAQGGTGVIRYSGCMSAYATIARTEGLKGLWKGTAPNVCRNSVVNATELVSYELIKETILKYKLMSDNLPCHVVSAFCCGFVTTVLASPIDVVKTRYMNAQPGQYKGALNCATLMFRERGFLGFYKGFMPSFVRLGSWNICMFVAFEQLKRGFTYYGSDLSFPSPKISATVSAAHHTHHPVTKQPEKKMPDNIGDKYFIDPY